MFNGVKILSIKNTAIFLIVVFNLFLGQSVSLAARQTFEATGSYCVENNNADLVATAKRKAREIAFRNVREKAGYYIESYSRISSFLLTEDDINVTLGNILNIISEKEEIEALPDGKAVYICKIKAEVDTENIDFQSMKDYRKSSSMSIIDYYKKDLVKLFEDKDGFAHYLKVNDTHYDNDGNLCCTIVDVNDKYPSIAVGEFVINTVDRLCNVKFIKFYDKQTGELESTPEMDLQIKIGQWNSFDRNSLSQYALDYVRGLEDKNNLEFLLTHFSSEKSFLHSIATKHFETGNNFMLSNHYVALNSNSTEIFVEAFIPDTVEKIGNDKVKYKTINMCYSTDMNPIKDLESFDLGGLAGYSISDWEFDRNKNTVTEKKVITYDPKTNKVIQKEDSNIFFIVPNQISQNNLLVENALFDFYRQYLR